MPKKEIIKQIIKEVRSPLLTVSFLLKLDKTKSLLEYNDNPKLYTSFVRKSIVLLDKQKKEEKKKKKLEKKLTDKKYWWDMAWKVFSLYVRNRDGWRCCACGIKLGDIRDGKRMEKKNFHAGHWIEQSLLTKYHEMNFDPTQVNCQCSKCNLWYEGNKALYAEYLITKYGVNIIQELNKKRRLNKMLDANDLQNIYTKYKV